MVNKVGKIHFVNIAYDGIVSIHSGVGQCVHNIARAVSFMNREAPRKVGVYLLTPNYPERILAPGLKVFNKSQTLCQQSGGEVVFLPYTVPIRNQFGSIRFWQEVSDQAAQYLKRLSLTIDPDDKIIALCHDTAFAGVAPMLAKRLHTRKVHIDWLPHCTGKLYEGENFDQQRYEWELAAIHHPSSDVIGYRVGVLSDFIGNHLATEFQSPKRTLFRFRNGIITEDSEDKDAANIRNTLHREGIPEGRNLFFSWGRGNRLKGFDIFLRLGKYLQRQYDFYPVLLMPVAQEDPSFAEELLALKEQLALDCTIILRFDGDFPKHILRYPLTKMVGLFSRMDVFPTTAMEARLYANNAVLVTSRCGGLVEQIKDGEDGYTLTTDPIEECLSFVDRIMQVQEQWPQVISKGKRVVLEQYSLSRNLAAYFSEILG